MNLENLKTLIQCYEDNLGLIYGSKHDELFKWKAVQHFRDVWYAPENESLSFAQRFNKAKKESSVLIDNSRVSPSNGVVKLAEIAESEVEHLFFDVLLADDGGDINIRQNNMDAFMEGMEALRAKHYPQFWKYKQDDRHAASCYLCFFAPDDNFIYHYTEVETFAQYVEYGIDIGSGRNFRLDAYYKMCEEVIAVLRESTSLLEKQKKLISGDEFYDDEALHLLAFNLIWCSNTYNFYRGMTHISKKESIKEYTLAKLREKEQAELEEKRNALLEEIRQLKLDIAPYKDISLVGVQVAQKQYGTGTIIAQDVNVITVEFETCEKKYKINRNIIARPTFEDDEEIVEAFTEYEEKKNKLDKLDRELKTLQ